jgi:hypothetical protein
VVPAIRASQLEDLLIGQDVQPANTVPATVDGKTVQQPNPAYAKWVAQDQSVLGYLLSSLTREALLHITTCTTSADVWRTIASLYSTQTRARSVNTHIALTTTRKNQLSISDYFAKVRSYADEMASAGNALTDEELVSYILTGLDEDYNPVFTAIVARIDSVTSSDLYTQLLSFKQHLALQAGGSHGGAGSALAASRVLVALVTVPAVVVAAALVAAAMQETGGAPTTRPLCQVCRKIGHTTDNCWHQFDEEYMPEPRTAGSATASYDTDPNWYTDSGAPDHITGELDKLTMHDCYNGNDQIHVANGAGMEISRIGKSIVPTPSRNFVLNNVLHVPTAHKNLISVHRFTLDNNTFIEFHPYFS